jgi:AP-3 complex subunit mu
MLLEDVVITIPFPANVKTANLSSNTGTVLYDEAAKVARWNIKSVGLGGNAELKGTMVMKGGERPTEAPPLRLEWKIPTASVSGLAVSGLR